MEEVDDRSWNSLWTEGKKKRGRGLSKLMDTTRLSNQSLPSFVNNTLAVFAGSVARKPPFGAVLRRSTNLPPR